MLRRLYNVLCVTSLLLCVLVLALWLRSGFVSDVIQFGRGNEDPHITWGDDAVLRSATGVIGISCSRHWPVDSPAHLRIETWYFKKEARQPVGSRVRRWFRWSVGYEWQTVQRAERNFLFGDCRVAVTVFRCQIPHWLLALLLAFPPTLRWAVPWWRRRAHVAGASASAAATTSAAAAGGARSAGTKHSPLPHRRHAA